MERQYVGIDLHRRSTTLYRMAENGEVLGCEPRQWVRRSPDQPEAHHDDVPARAHCEAPRILSRGTWPRSGSSDQVALEQAEVVRARISGIAQSLRESGVGLRAVDIPRSERPELLSCAGSN